MRRERQDLCLSTTLLLCNLGLKPEVLLVGLSQRGGCEAGTGKGFACLAGMPGRPRAGVVGAVDVVSWSVT